VLFFLLVADGTNKFPYAPCTEIRLIYSFIPISVKFGLFVW